MANRNARKGDPAYQQFYDHHWRKPIKPSKKQNITVSPKGKATTQTMPEEQRKAGEIRRKREALLDEHLLEKELGEVWG